MEGYPVSKKKKKQKEKSGAREMVQEAVKVLAIQA